MTKKNEILAKNRNQTAKLYPKSVLVVIFQLFTKLHAITNEELPLKLKYNDCSHWNWNTNCTYEHLSTQWGGGNKTVVAAALQMPESELDNEYKWITGRVLRSEYLKYMIYYISHFQLFWLLLSSLMSALQTLQKPILTIL